jgi:dTDP-4-dehydrorhamnose reductase
MERILVIGAAGMLGREVVRAAQAHGAEVVPAGRAPRPGWVTFDAERTPAEELFHGRELGLVVNCAAALASEIDPADETSVERAHALNARFPHTLAAAAERAGARVLHVSTDAVFREDAGVCFEDDERFADDVYGLTKRLGEPAAPDALTIRGSFVGRDPLRRRGLLEWLLRQAPGAEVSGYVDHAWNGVASTQFAGVCAALSDPLLFERARAEGGVHHLHEDPPLSKYDLLVECARAFEAPVSVAPRESGAPSTRLLGSRHRVLTEQLESLPPRARALAELAERGNEQHG